MTPTGGEREIESITYLHRFRSFCTSSVLFHWTPPHIYTPLPLTLHSVTDYPLVSSSPGVFGLTYLQLVFLFPVLWRYQRWGGPLNSIRTNSNPTPVLPPCWQLIIAISLSPFHVVLSLPLIQARFSLIKAQKEGSFYTPPPHTSLSLYVTLFLSLYNISLSPFLSLFLSS